MKKLLIVLGAGASIDFGMPSVNQIDELFDKWSYQYFPLISRQKFDDNLYRWIKDNFKNPNIDNPNFEDTLYNIQTLLSFDEGNDRKIISPFDISNVRDSPKIRAYHNYETKAGSRDFLLLNAVLNHELLKYFRDKCKDLDVVKKVELAKIREFFSHLSSDYELGFINLNYDNIVLSALPELKTGFDYHSGKFDMRSFYTDDWNFCYHMHGSIHFDMRDNEEISWNANLTGEFGSGAPNRRGFTTPEGFTHPRSTIITGQDKINQIYRQPFRQYFLKLDQRIFEADTILFIGYGFNDSYLNKLIRTHAKDESKKRNIVVIDMKNETDTSLSEGGNKWGKNVLSAAGTPFYQMGNGNNINVNYRPDKVGAYKRTRTFEFSDSSSNPLYIWYSGFLDACDNKEKIKRALDGYFYEPDGSISKKEY